ncbi:MAG: hypothetical protein GC168_05140 [Candidatus Hydrogenedens sp.]|nr:hypothetical protein [Candidatus Hydrogenedens sp.]
MSRTIVVTACLALLLVGCVTTIDPTTVTPEEREYHEQYSTFPTEFEVPESEAETAWARGIRYISDHSGMKIQTSTDYSISTYSPTGHGAYYFGYSITRLPENDTVTFKVDCLRDMENFGDLEVANNNAHILAYYMKSGELMPRFINTRGIGDE